LYPVGDFFTHRDLLQQWRYLIMTVEELLKQGDLQEALQKLQNLVKVYPGNIEYRIFLFQLLSVMGQWDRALTQLSVAAELDDATLAMVAMYRQVIDCERFREAGWLCRFRH
jgi:type VI secretion system protein ImpE